MATMLEDLKSVSLFQEVEENHLRTLAERARRRRLPEGRMVFKEGSPARSLYVIVEGEVKIFLRDEAGKEVVLDTKKPGQYFGEMMLDHRPRSASVMTVEPSEFAVISREDFRKFLHRHPGAAEQVIVNLIRVTRDMNERTREEAKLAERLRNYIEGLQDSKPPNQPTVQRWLVAKRWVLAGLLALALAQYYFMDVLLKIMSLENLTVITGR